MVSFPWIIIGPWSDGDFLQQKEGYGQGPRMQWSSTLVVDTISSSSTDTIAIMIGSFGDAALLGKTRFDNIQLRRIATLGR